jgi:signal transduction histidine kinase
LRGGAQDYVQKPIDREYFIHALTHAISRHRLSRKVAQQKQTLEKQTRELEKCLEDRTKEIRELYQREALARAGLEKATAELEASRRRRHELVSMIAHDLSTPLTTVRGYVELLTRPEVSPAVRDRARTVIMSETNRMVRLVQDLVEDAEAQREGFSIERGTCDLVDILREQIEVIGARAGYHMPITLEAPARLPLRCDRARVAQVIANLLNNALAHAPESEVAVRAWREGQDAQVSVTDSGPGIPAESLDTIFEPHVRLRRRKGDSPNGSGLGLAIAREIVEAHGGRIWVESQPGHGATFSLVLPASVGHHVRRKATRSATPGAARRRGAKRITLRGVG